jgi:hypothetical protein
MTGKKRKKLKSKIVTQKERKNRQLQLKTATKKEGKKLTVKHLMTSLPSKEVLGRGLLFN